MKKQILFKSLTSTVLAIAFLLTIALSSCKKDDKDSSPSKYKKLNEAQINTCIEGAATINAEMMSFVYEAAGTAAEAGYGTGTIPNIDGKKSTHVKPMVPANAADMSWSGPDANGWYTRSYEYLFKYTEQVRYGDTIEYVQKIEYNGGDGNYSNIINTKYMKHVDNGKVLYDGYSDQNYHSSGYSNNSRVEWKIGFKNWNPLTNAGKYDWWWGVSENSGGYTVPLYKYEHLDATETNNNILHVHVYWYQENGSETWDYEYDTAYAPVVMPEIPTIQ